jgi:hypothetical protein
MDTLTVAENYYRAMSNKDPDAMGKCIDPNLHFIGPLSELKGKEAFVEAARGFVNLFDRMWIREKFAAGDKAVFIYDLDCFPPIGKLRVAAFLTVKDSLIRRLELFFDGSPFD